MRLHDRKQSGKRYFYRWDFRRGEIFENLKESVSKFAREKATIRSVRLKSLKNGYYTLSQIPDLNPMEHLWDELDRRLKIMKITSKDELREAKYSSGMAIH